MTSSSDHLTPASSSPAQVIAPESEGWAAVGVCFAVGMATRLWRPELGSRPERMAAWAGLLHPATAMVASGGQCHGTTVAEIHGAGPSAGGTSQAMAQVHPETDAFITREAGVALAVYTADCVPVVLADPATGWCGIAHCGWRGTLQGLAGRLAAALMRRGCEPGNLHAWVAPAISGAVYEVSPEIIAQWHEAFPEFAPRVCCGRLLDLPHTCRLQLEAAGLQPARIEVSKACTFSDPERFYSYRRDGSCGAHLITAIVRRPGA